MRASNEEPKFSLHSISPDLPPPSTDPHLSIAGAPCHCLSLSLTETSLPLQHAHQVVVLHVIPPILRQWKRWHRRHRAQSYLPSSSGDLDSLPYDSPFFDPSDGFHIYSPYGLDESVIKTIPLSLYTAKSNRDRRDCAVCLWEFEDGDYVHTLPVCSHAFHVDCIDVWLRSHANCPLCRAGIFRSESPFIPVMAARIRPSLDDALLRSIALEPLTKASPEAHRSVSEITPCIDELQSPMRIQNTRWQKIYAHSQQMCVHPWQTCAHLVFVFEINGSER